MTPKYIYSVCEHHFDPFFLIQICCFSSPLDDGENVFFDLGDLLSYLAGRKLKKVVVGGEASLKDYINFVDNLLWQVGYDVLDATDVKKS